MKNILIATMGSNLLEIHTAIQHAKNQVQQGFDDILFVHDGNEDVQPLKRLAENCDASLWTLQNAKYRQTGSNFRVAEKPLDIQADDQIRLDYTGNNKHLAVEVAAQLADAQRGHHFFCDHTYLQTEGQTFPCIQSTAWDAVQDVRFKIEPLDPFTLNGILFGTSNKNGNTPTTFEFRRIPITRHDFIEFIPREHHSDSRWQFEHLIQVGAHQLIFFIKPKMNEADNLHLELMQLYNRMNRIGGYSARGVLLYDYNLDNRHQMPSEGLTHREIDNIMRDVVDLCETDTEKATKTRTSSSFDRYDYKWNVSSYQSRLMRTRVEVWGIERHADADLFQKYLERYLEFLI